MCTIAMMSVTRHACPQTYVGSHNKQLHGEQMLAPTTFDVFWCLCYINLKFNYKIQTLFVNTTHVIPTSYTYTMYSCTHYQVLQ